jgi:hypothetical protein
MEGGVAAQLRTLGQEARGGILGRITRGELGTLQVFIALALIWTIFSGGDYLWRAWPLLSGQPSPPGPTDTPQVRKSSAK